MRSSRSDALIGTLVTPLTIMGSGLESLAPILSPQCEGLAVAHRDMPHKCILATAKEINWTSQHAIYIKDSGTWTTKSLVKMSWLANYTEDHTLTPLKEAGLLQDFDSDGNAGSKQKHYHILTWSIPLTHVPIKAADNLYSVLYLLYFICTTIHCLSVHWSVTLEGQVAEVLNRLH